MRLPYIVTHVVDNESKTATLGFQIFYASTAGLFIPLPGAAAAAHTIDANTWLICVAIASALIGGKLVAESVLEAIALKLGKPAGAAAPAPAATEPAKAAA